MRALWKGRYTTALLSSAVAADAATGGRFWLVNELSSGLFVYATRFRLTAGVPVVASLPQTRVNIERMTFTGTPSGAVGVPAPDDSADVLPAGVSIRTASTGMVIAAGALVGSALLGVTATAAGIGGAQAQANIGEAACLIRPGEGLVVRQADAGDVNKPFVATLIFEVHASGIV